MSIRSLLSTDELEDCKKLVKEWVGNYASGVQVGTITVVAPKIRLSQEDLVWRELRNRANNPPPDQTGGGGASSHHH